MSELLLDILIFRVSPVLVLIVSKIMHNYVQLTLNNYTVTMTR